MRPQHRIWFVWLWTASLLAAGIGVSVQQVYCYCVGKSNWSIFRADDACQAAPLAAACCKKPEKPAPKASCCHKPDQKKDDCTRKTTKVFQLKEAFEVWHFGLKKLPAAPPALPAFQPAPVLYSRCALPAFRHPPPLSGRTICMRQNIFRC